MHGSLKISKKTELRPRLVLLIKYYSENVALDISSACCIFCIYYVYTFSHVMYALCIFTFLAFLHFCNYIFPHTIRALCIFAFTEKGYYIYLQNSIFINEVRIFMQIQLHKNNFLKGAT